MSETPLLLPSSDQSPSFNDTFDNFFILSEKVLQHNLEGELSLSSNRGNGITTGFNQYRALYNANREGKGHLEKIKAVYMQCRPYFLKEIPMDLFMRWFLDSSSFVLIPSEKSPRKLYLTVIFRKCCKIANHLAEEADKYPDRADVILSNPSATYPEQFMLCLFRLFWHCADEIDRRTMINSRIDELEKMLGLSKGEVAAVGDGITDMFSMMTGVAKEAGLTVPEGTPQVSGTQFRESLSQMTRDPQVRDVMKDLFSGVKDAKDIPTAINGIFGKMQQNVLQIPEPLKRSMEATAEGNS